MNMLASLALCLALLAPNKFAQGVATILLSANADQLAGTTKLEYDENYPVEGVKLELCDEAFQNCYASVTSDSKGYFDFGIRPVKKVYYLRSTYDEFQEIHMVVKIKKHSGSLKIEMVHSS